MARMSWPWIRNRAENSGSVWAGPVRDRSVIVASAKAYHKTARCLRRPAIAADPGRHPRATVRLTSQTRHAGGNRSVSSFVSTEIPGRKRSSLAQATGGPKTKIGLIWTGWHPVGSVGGRNHGRNSRPHAGRLRPSVAGGVRSVLRRGHSRRTGHRLATRWPLLKDTAMRRDGRSRRPHPGAAIHASVVHALHVPLRIAELCVATTVLGPTGWRAAPGRAGVLKLTRGASPCTGSSADSGRVPSPVGPPSGSACARRGSGLDCCK